MAVICPCGSKKTYDNCCGLYIEQQHSAPTPEALMRSRYSAYALAKIDYIVKTMRGPAAENFKHQDAQMHANHLRWVKLEVLSTNIASQHFDKGFVEFKAYYQQQGQLYCLHERSEFQYIDHHWYYVDGQIVNAPLSTTKIGRNDACICGSGKKYKKCCGIDKN